MTVVLDYQTVVTAGAVLAGEWRRSINTDFKTDFKEV